MSARILVYKKTKMEMDYVTLEAIIKQVEEIRSKEAIPPVKEYFETEIEYDYEDKYTVTYYVVVRPENDEEYSKRIGEEDLRKKVIADREKAELKRLLEKYQEM